MRHKASKLHFHGSRVSPHDKETATDRITKEPKENKRKYGWLSAESLTSHFLNHDLSLPLILSPSLSLSLSYLVTWPIAELLFMINSLLSRSMIAFSMMTVLKVKHNSDKP